MVLNFEQMGLAFNKILPGMFIAILAAGTIVIGTSIIATIPILRRFFGDKQTIVKLITTEKQPLQEFPFSALIEEVLFRGVLLDLLLQHNTFL